MFNFYIIKENYKIGSHRSLFEGFHVFVFFHLLIMQGCPSSSKTGHPHTPTQQGISSVPWNQYYVVFMGR